MCLHTIFIKGISISLMNLRHLPTSANFPQDIISHIQVVHRLQVKSMHSLIRVWFLNPFRRPSSQSYLLIVQSIICDKNQKHFNQFTMSLLFYVILFYMFFLVSAAASVGTEQRSTGPLVPLYLPLSEFVNTDRTI